MLVQVAYVVTTSGDAVLRATPEEVRHSVEHARGEVLFSLEHEVHSAEEEWVRLWGPFVAEAQKHGKMSFAEQASELFFRKGKNLWTTFMGVPNVAIFPSWHDDVVVQVSKKSAQ